MEVATVADDPGGFLGRWSRRKVDAREGKPLAEPVATPAPVVPPAAALPGAVAPIAPADRPDAAPPADAEPLPTLDDVKTLTPESDFKPFMAQGVSSEVKNAAVKKLFTDPHFNVMDRLDTYIDDYSKPDPLPASMLRQMVSAKFLKLFDDDEDDDKNQTAGSARPVQPRDDADTPSAQSVAHSTDARATSDAPDSPIPSDPDRPAQPAASPTDHAHPDLRLQPDDAAPAQSAGRSA
jgi:Protein of unknown function (DUF3306)